MLASFFTVLFCLFVAQHLEFFTFFILPPPPTSHVFILCSSHSLLLTQGISGEVGSQSPPEIWTFRLKLVLSTQDQLVGVGVGESGGGPSLPC